MKTGDAMLYKVPWGRRKRHASVLGICFEPLEPRLLLSGSWGAAMDSPAPAGPPVTQSDFAQQTVAIHESPGTFGVDGLQQNKSQLDARLVVDILASTPAIGEFRAVNAVSGMASSTDQETPASSDACTPPLNEADRNESNSDPQAGSMVAAAKRELIFINGNVSDYEQLIADLQGNDDQRSVELVVLDSSRGRIEQVSEILSDRSNLTAVHFITHGTDGQINLGNTWLNSAILQKNIDAISAWGNALTETGDILFYGCNIAADGTGQSLLKSISDLTHADVAASDDPTGTAQLGGDWDLEYRTGPIEAQDILSAAFESTSCGTLAWYNADWHYRQTVTIAQTMTPADLTNFTVLVSVTDAKLKDAANGGYVGQSDGGDFVFTASDGTTKLNHEIESYDASTGTLVVWVQVPLVSSTTDTVLNLYYGNATCTDQWSAAATWNSSYEGVWHLGANYQDSTANANNATALNNPTASTGQIGGSRTFASTSELDIAASSSLDLSTYSNWTISAWVKPTSYTGTKWPLIYSYGSYDASLGLTVTEGADGLIENWTNDATLRQSATPVTLNDWNFVAITRTPTTTTFYLNGAADGSGSSAVILQSGQASYIGNDGLFTSDQFIGLIDEVRVASTAQSASELTAQYRNQSAPGTYVTLSAETGNTAPTLDATKSPTLTSENEDAGPPVGAGGDTGFGLGRFRHSRRPSG
jgi:hypothetical protein